MKPPRFILAASLWIAAPQASIAQTPPAVDPVIAAEKAAEHDDGRRTLRRLPANLGRGAIGVFHRDNLWLALIGGATAGTASTQDDAVRDAIAGDSNWSQTFETAGGPLYSSIFVAGMFTAGRLSHSNRFRALTYDLLEAAVVDFTYASVLKVSVRRERPDGHNNQSFPSAHTSHAFAMATVAQQYYGWKVGVPAYLFAGTMGVSRLRQNKHWLSDVMAGATLGYIVGRTVVRVNSRPLAARVGRQAEWNLAPIVARHAGGLQLGVAF